MSAPETDASYFQPARLLKYIKLKVRRQALQELELLIAQKGADRSASLLEAKRAIQELDFNKAEQILYTNEIWEEEEDNGGKKQDNGN
jgi:hypothetical protein